MQRGKKQTFANLEIIYAILTIGISGFIARAHHIYLYAAGTGIDTQVHFTAAIIFIAVTTEIRIFCFVFSDMCISL